MMIVSAPPMDPPTVLEGLSDAAKVVLLDYAAQPKIMGAMVQIYTAVETPGRKGYQGDTTLMLSIKRYRREPQKHA